MGSFNRMVMTCFSTKWDASYSQLHPSVGAAAAGRKYVVGCHTPTISSDHSNRFSPISTTTRLDLKSRFLEAYDSLKSELICDPFFEFDDVSRQWVDQMIDYNVPGGKMIRGLCVVNIYQFLKGEQLTDEEVHLACALGWSIEWLQAYFLVHDDITDGSQTRRGQPCWFRLPKVEMIAVNDGIILRNHIHQILKKHFQGKSSYVHLLDLFNEVEYLTVYGQMIDLMSTHREKDLSKYSMSLYRRIAEHKTSYYSLYLPVACALLLSGDNLQNLVQVKDILVEMGIYCTVQDDYFDAFGDPDVIGKSGTDIENFKCSWLVVKALELANEEQKKILNENYGIKDSARIAKVKEMYNTLNLQGEYEEYENKSREDFIRSIEAHPSQEMQEMLKYLLGKIYKRQK